MTSLLRTDNLMRHGIVLGIVCLVLLDEEYEGSRYSRRHRSLLFIDSESGRIDIEVSMLGISCLLLFNEECECIFYFLIQLFILRKVLRYF